MEFIYPRPKRFRCILIPEPPVTVVVMVMAMMVVVVIVVMIVVVLMVVVLGAKVIKCTVAKRDKTHAI